MIDVTSTLGAFLLFLAWWWLATRGDVIDRDDEE